MLTTAQSFVPGEGAAAVLRLSWPVLVGIVLLAVGAAAFRPAGSVAVDDVQRAEPVRRTRGERCVVLVALGVTVLLPIVSLGWRSSLVGEMGLALRTYGRELIGSAVLCLGAGVVVMLVGVGVVMTTRFRVFLMAVVLLPAIVPGALVGEAILLAYQPIDIVYNNWPIVVLGLASRFAWIGVLVAWLATKSTPRTILMQASVDGADPVSARFEIQLAHQWPTLVCGVLLAGAMAMADVAVVTMVGIPQISMIAKILIEKFHRFETGMLVSLSLWLIGSVVPAAVVGGLVMRRR